MRRLLFIGALGCTEAPGAHEVDGAPAGSAAPLHAYDGTRYASSIVVEVDGVQHSFGDGEFWLTRVVGDVGACAPSALFQVRTLAGMMRAELYFDSDTLDGEATMPTAPYEHGSFGLWMYEFDGVEFVTLSGGTATYEQVGTEHRVTVEGTSRCTEAHNNPHEVDPATCDPVESFALTLTGTLGSGPDEFGSPGWSAEGGTAICIAAE